MRSHRVFLLGLWLACLLGGGPARAQVMEGDLKAAFVYNFAKFVEWPPETLGPPGSLFGVCGVGPADALIHALSRLGGKTVQGREINVRFPSVGKPESLRGCQIVVVGDAEPARQGDFARNALAVGALTVSAQEGFVEHGGMIGLVVQDNRVQFDINLEAVGAARLKLAAQFIRLARYVKK